MLKFSGFADLTSCLVQMHATIVSVMQVYTRNRCAGMLNVFLARSAPMDSMHQQQRHALMHRDTLGTQPKRMKQMRL